MSNEREDIEMNIKKLRELKKNKKGFTLIEIIVVVVILAVLMAVAVPSVLKYLNEADNAKYEAQARAVMMAAQTEVAKDAVTNAGYDGTDILNRVKNVSSVTTLTDLKIYVTAGTIENEGEKNLVWTGAGELASGKKGTDCNIVGVSGKLDGMPFVAVINDKIYLGAK